MRISINKDIEEAYKDQFMRGFSMQEVGWIALAFAAVAVVAVLLAFAGLRIDVAVYAAIPFCVPVIYIGFRKHYGMTQMEYWKAVHYEKATRELTCEEELPCEPAPVFSMTKKKQKEGA